MNRIIHLIVIFVNLISIALGQTPSTTSCSNSNFLLTSTLRQQILDNLNELRGTIENGLLLMNNGKYALKADSLPDLTWDCEIEERIHDFLEEACATPKSLEELDTMTWIHSRSNDDNVNTLVSDMLAQRTLLFGYNYPELSRHNLHIYGTSHLMNFIRAVSDKAQHVGCAIHHCNVPERNQFGMTFPAYISNNIYCQVSLTENLEFGDEIYHVSPSAYYIPPTQDVVCPNSLMSIEEREAMLKKVNEARSEISQGTYHLQNLDPAVQPAQPLTPLLWSCADESALVAEKAMNFQCTNPVINDEIEFEKIVSGTYFDQSAQNFLTWWTQLGSKLFDLNPNLNFLSQSAEYSEKYPAAFALSQNAESIACFRKTCWADPMSVTWRHICRVKPSIQLRQNLYNVV